jgi:hypothetical protein
MFYKLRKYIVRIMVTRKLKKQVDIIFENPEQLFKNYQKWLKREARYIEIRIENFEMFER